MSDLYAYNECRTLGHAWEPELAQNRPKDGVGWYMTVRCVRCNNVRQDVLDGRGGLMRRRYTPPKDYAAAKQTRSEWRLQFLNSLTVRKKAR